MLRLDAERFGRPSTTRRRATASGPASAAGSPGTASASRLAIAAPVDPPGRRRATCSSGRATGSGPCSAGSRSAALGVAPGRRLRVATATTGSASRTRWSYPGALLNSTATAFIDEVDVPRRPARAAARGRRSTRPSRIVIQTAGLRARDAPRARPGRDRYLLVPDARDRPRRRLADGPHRRHRARRSWATPSPAFAVFLTHRPRRPDQAARPRGRGDREAPPTARGLAGHRRSRSRPRATGDARPTGGTARTAPAGRSTSTSRSASRSARTATSWSTRVARRAGRRTGSRRSSRRCRSSSTCVPTRSTRASAPGRGRRSRPCTSAAARRRCCRRTTSRRSSSVVRGAVRARDRRRDHARGQPRAGRARRRGGHARGRRDAAVDRRPERSTRASSARSGRRHRARRRRASRRRGARGGHRIGQPRPAVRRPGQIARGLDRRRSMPRSALEPDHLSLYALTLDDPDAEGLTGPAGDHLPTTAGARRWRERARAAPGRGSRRRRVPPRRPAARRGRLARLRDQQLGPARPREPAQPRVLAAPAVRGGRARRPRLRRRDAGAGTPPGSTATSPRSRPPTGARRASRRAARETLDDATGRGRGGVILGLRTDRGVPARGRSTSRRSADASAGPSPPSCSSVTAGRPDRPHDPRPAALERALRRASSERADAARVDTRPRWLLRCRQRVSTLTLEC